MLLGGGQVRPSKPQHVLDLTQLFSTLNSSFWYFFLYLYQSLALNGGLFSYILFHIHG